MCCVARVFVGRTTEGAEVRRLGDNAVNLVPDKLIGFVVENGAQERLDAVEVEVIGDDSR